MSNLARRMGADDDIYRAVVEYENGDREHHGPFALIGSARARRTHRVNEANRYPGPWGKASGWVEKADVTWERVDD